VQHVLRHRVLERERATPPENKSRNQIHVRWKPAETCELGTKRRKKKRRDPAKKEQDELFSSGYGRGPQIGSVVRAVLRRTDFGRKKLENRISSPSVLQRAPVGGSNSDY